jgi:hypothetical protein
MNTMEAEVVSELGAEAAAIGAGGGLALQLGAPGEDPTTLGCPAAEVVRRFWRGGYFWLELSCGHRFCDLSVKPGIDSAATWPCPLCPRSHSRCEEELSLPPTMQDSSLCDRDNAPMPPEGSNQRQSKTALI